MAFTTEVSYTQSGSTNKDFIITFPFLASTDVKVQKNGTTQATSAYSITGSTVTFGTAPANNDVIRLFRDTNIDKSKITFQTGASIRAQDLNDSAKQTLYAVQEQEQASTTASGTGLALTTGTKNQITVNSATDWVLSSGAAAANLGANAIDSDHYVDASIDLEHMSSESVDEDNLKISNAGTNGQFLQKQSGNAGGLTWATPAFYTHPNHTGEVTSTADGATVITDNIVDEANLKIDNTPTNDYVLTAKSSAAGGLTWASLLEAAPAGWQIGFAHTHTTTKKDFSNGTWEDTGLSITYTPKSSSSILVLEARPIFYLAPSSVTGTGSAEVRFELDDAGSALDSATYCIFSGTSHNGSYGYDFSRYTLPIVFTHIYTNSNTNAKTFKLQGFERAGDTTFVMNPDGSAIGNNTARSYFTVKEIAT